jgi:hypothetical protein
MMSTLQSERRRFARVPFDGPVRAELLPPSSSNPVYRLLSADLSEGGARLSSQEFVAVESLVLLDLDAPISATPVRVVGRVAWAEHLAHGERWQVGVEFTDLTDEARCQLREIVRRAQAMTGP